MGSAFTYVLPYWYTIFNSCPEKCENTSDNKILDVEIIKKSNSFIEDDKVFNTDSCITNSSLFNK